MTDTLLAIAPSTAVMAPTPTLPAVPGSDAWTAAEPAPGSGVSPTLIDGPTGASARVKNDTLPASSTVFLGTVTGWSVRLVKVTKPLAGWLGKSRWPLALTVLDPSTSPEVTILAGILPAGRSTLLMLESAITGTSTTSGEDAGVTVIDAAGRTNQPTSAISSIRQPA